MKIWSSRGKKKKGKSFSKEHVYKAMLGVFIPELEYLIPESVHLILMAAALLVLTYLC